MHEEAGQPGTGLGPAVSTRHKLSRICHSQLPSSKRSIAGNHTSYRSFGGNTDKKANHARVSLVFQLYRTWTDVQIRAPVAKPTGHGSQCR